MKKFLIKTLILSATLGVVLSTPVYAEEDLKQDDIIVTDTQREVDSSVQVGAEESIQENVDDKTQTEANAKSTSVIEDGNIITQTEVYTGEKLVNGKWCYFDENGEMVKNQFIHLSNKYVYYGADGGMLYGEQTIDDAQYFFDLITGARYSGEKVVKGKWAYYGQDGKLVKNQFVNLSGKTVYYGADGGMLYGSKAIGDEETGVFNYFFDTRTGARYTGEKVYNGKWCYYGVDGKLVANTLVKLSGKTVYYGADSGMLYGTQEIDGFTYNFDKQTGALKLGFATVNGKKYYYTLDGIVKGEKQINGKWYYFDETTAEMRIGWVDHHNHRYYYDNNGCMLYGEQGINGAWYYFNPGTGIMRTGWVDHHNHRYYYDENGKMVHGWYAVDEITYLFDKVTGVWQNGWQKEGDKYYYFTNNTKTVGEKYISGHWYYFDENGEMVTGWAEHHGHRYYYNENGYMQYGWVTVDNVGYYFATYTGICVEGLQKEDGKVYYYENGEQYIGQKYLEKKWYYFEPEMVIGWKDISGKRVYYSTDGAMVYGERAISGKWYYFDKYTGAMTKGWCDINGKRVYYGTDGAMMYGEQYIEGRWFYLDKYTGAQVRGWYNLSGKRVYYAGDGAMVHGYQVIDGMTYYFDQYTGALVMDAMTSKAQGYGSSTQWLILVNTSSNQVGIYRGSHGNWNRVQYWQCTSGAYSSPTAKGEFSVGGRGLVFGSGYSCWYYTQFYGNYLFHSVLYSPGSQSSLIDGRLGINASHGCVRLAIFNAKWIYDNIPSGTKVVVY